MKRSSSYDVPKVAKRKLTEKNNVNPSGSLLKFGFTGAPKGEPFATTVEFSQCPHCSGLFNSLSIFEHVERCCSTQCVFSDDNASPSTMGLPKPSVVPSNTNAFDIMRKSAAIKPASTPGATSVYFALLLKDDKLLPILSTSADYMEQMYTQCNTSSNANKWCCEANVKKFRWRFDSSEPSHRSIVLHISTNIPRDPNVSFADAAPISTGWLKSMLQKAVRRKLHTKAMKLVNMMCKSTTTSGAGTMDSRSDANSSGSAIVNTRERSGSTMFNKSSSRPTKSNPSIASNNASLLSELLRRLPIICLEDAALHPAYPIIIWLMVAISKGYTPCRFLIDVVLLVTHDIANCTYKDCTPPNEYSLCADTTNAGDRNLSNNAVTSSSGTGMGPISDSLHTFNSIENDSIRTLIACICIRASFGGMAGDMEMLDQYALLWYQRLVCEDNTPYTDGTDSGSQNNVVMDAGTVISVVNSRGCIESAVMDCYLHTTYTATLLTSTAKSCASWAKQMYDNFPTSSPLITSTACIKQEVPSIVTDSGSDITHTIATIVEQYLLHILQNANNSKSISTTAINPTNQSTPTYKPTPKLSTLLRVTAEDLVSEGLDHHCDWGLVPSILSICTESAKQLSLQLEAMSVSPTPDASDNIRGILSLLNDARLEDSIKNAIWLFRSANNSRKLYPLIGQNAHIELNRAVFTYHQELVDSDLAQKRSLARLWGIVCPMIVAYCERKMSTLAQRL